MADKTYLKPKPNQKKLVMWKAEASTERAAYRIPNNNALVGAC
jgi:hypothetical protein